MYQSTHLGTALALFLSLVAAPVIAGQMEGHGGHEGMSGMKGMSKSKKSGMDMHAMMEKMMAGMSASEKNDVRQHMAHKKPAERKAMMDKMMKMSPVERKKTMHNMMQMHRDMGTKKAKSSLQAHKPGKSSGHSKATKQPDTSPHQDPPHKDHK